MNIAPKIRLNLKKLKLRFTIDKKWNRTYLIHQYIRPGFQNEGRDEIIIGRV